jgi:hypothetical protein
MHGLPPVHEQLGAPLQFTVQLPAVQPVIRQATAAWHVSVQPPPAQSSAMLQAVGMGSKQLPRGHDV